MVELNIKPFGFIFQTSSREVLIFLINQYYENIMANSIHQEVHLATSPEKVFETYMTSEKHTEFTGGKAADISTDNGGTFSCHNGAISGRNIEIVPSKRIVQAWRVANWDEGVYSIVRIELASTDSGTNVVLDHAGFPEGQGEHLAGGWHENYWKPLAQYLS